MFEHVGVHPDSVGSVDAGAGGYFTSCRGCYASRYCSEEATAVAEWTALTRSGEGDLCTEADVELAVFA